MIVVWPVNSASAHGRPTANKLYGLVRKGSMGTPTEVLAQFWADLRGKMCVTIDHPELTDALKRTQFSTELERAREQVLQIANSANGDRYIR